MQDVTFGKKMVSIQRVMAAIDFSEASIQAARIAASLARAYTAKLYLLHVKAPFPSHGRITGGFLEAVQQKTVSELPAKLSEVLSSTAKAGIPIEEIQIIGTPVHRVIAARAMELGIDMIILGAGRRKGLDSFFRKNVAERLIQDAPCSVLVVRPSKNFSTEVNYR
jgi:universal stress protein A